MTKNPLLPHKIGSRIPDPGSRLFLLLFLACLIAACASPRQRTELLIPPRPPAAMTGAEFYSAIENLDRLEREDVIRREVSRGNMPPFLRRFVPVTIEETINGKPHVAVFFAAPDYVSIGSDADFFRMPMSATMAQEVADATGTILPTRKMVDAIHQAAPVKLAPRPFSPEQYEIDHPRVFALSNDAIEEQRAEAGAQVGDLVSGIKKDIVITNQILNRPPPPRVFIYGWHQENGKPIQPLSGVHIGWYHDYSHGVRLIAPTMLLDGQWVAVADVLRDPDLHPLLSDEGPLGVVGY